LKPRLLLDTHVPADVVEAVRKVCPGVEVEHVSTWQNAAYINAEDSLLLEACCMDDRALVSKDRATLPGWIALRVAEGKEHGGVLLYDLERFKTHQIGALANAIASALKHSGGKLRNRWITLR
jgi:predicted nuclease of predicted toxin-antitoxin system